MELIFFCSSQQCIYFLYSVMMAIFFAVTHFFYYFFVVFYTSFPIVAHHLASSTVGVMDYADFHYPHPASLYCYVDKERTCLIRDGSGQTMSELVTSTLFSGADRTGLPKPYIIFGDAIDTKNSLLLPHLRYTDWKGLTLHF